MTAVDLDAELIPGKAAAGWLIGDRLAECGDRLHGAEEVEYRPGFHLNDAISRNAGVLVVRNYFPLGSGHTAVFFGADVVRFEFNAAGELFCAWAFEKYRGLAFGRIGIGSPLDEVRVLFPVVWDDGDEMYFPDLELSPEAPRGIAFCAAEDEQPGGTPIHGISINDLELMRRARGG
jgi:hypothetical protein